MRLAIEEADGLVHAAMMRAGFDTDEARIITDHVMGCELRGVSFGGLSRALSLIDRSAGAPRRPIRVLRDTPVSAVIDGQDQNGYLVAHRAVMLGIEKARVSGIGAVGAYDTWYTGMYAHYLEIAAEAGMVAMAMGSSGPRVAPHGAREGRFGTNPIGFAFPTADRPVILDIATSATPIAELVLAQRTGRTLPEGTAFDATGEETVDPMAALAGAIRVWGGHKGSGLAIVVQMMGILVGGGAMPADYQECGFFFLAMRPDLFGDEAAFRRRASDYAEKVRGARPEDPARPVRMPFDRSAETRAGILARGFIEVPDGIVAELVRIRNEGVRPGRP